VLDKTNLDLDMATPRVTRRAMLNELAETSTRTCSVNVVAEITLRLVTLRSPLANLPLKSTPCSNKC
jgi:hypothetical protein